MSDSISDSISAKKIHHALQQLLDGYLSEKAESQRDDDTYHIGYWDSACQTIYDVAAALSIPLEEKPGTRRPLTPDSLTPLKYDDVHYPRNGLAEYRQYDAS